MTAFLESVPVLLISVPSHPAHEARGKSSECALEMVKVKSTTLESNIRINPPTERPAPARSTSVAHAQPKGQVDCFDDVAQHPFGDFARRAATAD
ncbi:hypothetical protein RHECIAT_CH0000576 [Rhizobium etli CIAT 652]|uniref:Uncharacterized protein n=1 Tax=Rhizobium etli (strain CIAT 652) TaxID=491916 RepID=B3PNK6_RHIE6|nr:hypothetical protein RHECIAT_CH0000576 [Rhizobium etli CIAT 652]KKZ87954.1 hypothetical protein RPHASCH2410_CH09525 [Rhizobium phaseoli Ch24-10]